MFTFNWNPLKLIGSRTRGKHAGLPALATCRTLIRMVAALQQHRGLSSGWLAGDESFKARMLQRRQEIDNLFPVLRPGFDLETDEFCPCFTTNDWRIFQFRWREAVEALPQASINDNLERHNGLVARLLDWLAALGESRIELPAGTCLPAGPVRNFAIHLPALTECLGQARALGSSVAAKGVCSPVARVRLNYLATRAETLLQRASSADRSGRGGRTAQPLIGTMVGMVRTELLGNGDIAISSERYFDAATQAIDAVYAWIGQAGDEVESALRSARRAPTDRPGSSTGLSAVG